MLSSIPCDKSALAGLRHRRAVVVVACIVIGVVLYHAWSSVDQRIAQYASADVCKVSTIHKDGDVIALDRIESYLQAHLYSLQQGFDADHDLAEYGLKLGNISLPIYTTELLAAEKTYLSPNENTYLPHLTGRLSLVGPTTPLPPRPKQIFTTDKSRDALPDEFDRWQEIMPDWQIRYFDDEALVQWIQDNFGGTRAESIWKSLPRQVLKTDLFRYMAMLVEGGIYTDSDTAPIIHADLWGMPYETLTDGKLAYISEMLAFAKRTNEHEMPSLVISVESDAVDFGWANWRDIGLSRAVQITQWTFITRPGHPVMLDAIHRVLSKSETMAEQARALGESFIPETALEWSGPAVLTDCVYRYLLARYGFHPSQLIHKKSPVRIGDILILPAGSYSSVSPFKGETQRKWAASWHGFFGRWRGADPGVQEYERLKKLREDAKAQ